MFNRINFSKIFTVLLLFIFMCGFNNAQARIYYVDDDATGANNGSSWENAFNHLQYALYAAFYNDEIRVAQGVYSPNHGFLPDADTMESLGERESSFRLYHDITIRGGYAGLGAENPDAKDYKLYKTILTGDLNRDDVDLTEPNALETDATRVDNCWHIITCKSNSVLDGLFFVGGSAIGPISATSDKRRRGGAIYNTGNPKITNCTFAWNSAIDDGGAIYSTEGDMNFENCEFSYNWADNEGGAIYNYYSNLYFKDCKFSRNYSFRGGSIYNITPSAIEGSGTPFLPFDETLQIKIELENCKFNSNTAGFSGGGICSESYNYIWPPIYDYKIDINLNLDITNCLFTSNSAKDGGAINLNSGDTTVITNSLFMANSAGSDGGGINITSTANELNITNSLFISNSADKGGGIYSNGHLRITNCTSVWDSASDEWGDFIDGLGLSMVNCIVWYCDTPIKTSITPGRPSGDYPIKYSNIQGGWEGTGNINKNPLFADPFGFDLIVGTEDDDLRLAPISSCVNSGDPSYIPDPNETDFNGKPRVFDSRIDMGAYEFQGIIYVDDDAYVPWYDVLYPKEQGTKQHPFDSIQEAISLANDEYTILVMPGEYSKFNFVGKAITVSGTEGAATIQARGDAVTFHTGEGPDSILKNFIIKGSDMAISLDYGSSPTIQNITVVDNDFGIAAYEDSNPDIRNCIFFHNRIGDLFGCEAWYSCLRGGTNDHGNFYANPLFVDEDNGDYHLKSEGWRWNENSESWTWDKITSPCIDAGDPCSPLGDEPLRIPRDPNNLYGINRRINMGAYGGSCQASIAPLCWFRDIYTPLPNPPKWVIDGYPKEIPDSPPTIRDETIECIIEMRAEPAEDASGYVEYFFECTNDSNYSSDWQTSREYIFSLGSDISAWDQGLRFRFKVRDLYLNETEWSEEIIAD